MFVLYRKGQKAKPGQSGQRSTDKVQRTKKNPGRGEIFRTYPHRLRGPPSLLYNGYRVFPGVKAAGAWCWPPTPI
jgi:hypothetical protein